VKHATGKALNKIDGLLEEVRKHAELKEKKPGIFYRKSSAFLHFHEDADGLFADLRVDGRFKRFGVNNDTELKKFKRALKNALLKKM
jgi:hypothetical protein